MQTTLALKYTVCILLMISPSFHTNTNVLRIKSSCWPQPSQETTALTIKRSETKATGINSAMEEPIKLNIKGHRGCLLLYLPGNCDSCRWRSCTKCNGEDCLSLKAFPILRPVWRAKSFFSWGPN